MQWNVYVCRYTSWTCKYLFMLAPLGMLHSMEAMSTRAPVSPITSRPVKPTQLVLWLQTLEIEIDRKSSHSTELVQYPLANTTSVVVFRPVAVRCFWALVRGLNSYTLNINVYNRCCKCGMCFLIRLSGGGHTVENGKEKVNTHFKMLMPYTLVFPENKKLSTHSNISS